MFVITINKLIMAKSIRKNKDLIQYALTINQHIALIMISFLKDPNLVKYFMEIFGTSEIEDARKFHQSLRETPQSCKINSCVPIGFNIPINSNLWRTHVELMKYISFTRQGFIQIDDVDEDYIEVHSVPDKIKILNNAKRLIDTRHAVSDEIEFPSLNQLLSAFTVFKLIMDLQPTEIETIDLLNEEDYREIAFICSESTGSIVIVID